LVLVVARPRLVALPRRRGERLEDDLGEPVSNRHLERFAVRAVGTEGERAPEARIDLDAYLESLKQRHAKLVNSPKVAALVAEAKAA